MVCQTTQTHSTCNLMVFGQCLTLLCQYSWCCYQWHTHHLALTHPFAQIAAKICFQDDYIVLPLQGPPFCQLQPQGHLRGLVYNYVKIQPAWGSVCTYHQSLASHPDWLLTQVQVCCCWRCCGAGWDGGCKDIAGWTHTCHRELHLWPQHAQPSRCCRGLPSFVSEGKHIMAGPLPSSHGSQGGSFHTTRQWNSQRIFFHPQKMQHITNLDHHCCLVDLPFPWTLKQIILLLTRLQSVWHPCGQWSYRASTGWSGDRLADHLH